MSNLPCTKTGTAYFCDIYSPIPVSEQLSYGFAIMRDKTSCCKCFELTWRSGTPAAGKKMQVQVLNIGVCSYCPSSSPIPLLSKSQHPPSTHACPKQDH